MGLDVKQFVKDRDAAFKAFVLQDDVEAVRQYCMEYGIVMPVDPKVMAAGVYKAVQYITTMPEDIKVKAAMKALELGFSPFFAPQKEDT